MGEQSQQEIERRFLVVSNEWRGEATGVCFTQGYLSTDPDRVVRVRVEGDAARLTIKGRKVGATAAEFEYSIPTDDAAYLLAHLCKPQIVEKTRYRIEHDGVVWEIDEFRGVNQGLVIAEVELEAETQTVKLPPWAGREITINFRYSNAALSEKPFGEWADEEKQTTAP